MASAPKQKTPKGGDGSEVEGSDEDGAQQEGEEEEEEQADNQDESNVDDDDDDGSAPAKAGSRCNCCLIVFKNPKDVADSLHNTKFEYIIDLCPSKRGDIFLLGLKL